MRCKTVYVNGRPIGEAFCWSDVNAILATKRIVFTAKPTKSEGPRGFFIDDSIAEDATMSEPTTPSDMGGALQPMEAGQDAKVREIADILITRYGKHAESHARLEALKARNRGEPRHVEAWEWIANAVIREMRAEEEELIERTTFVQNY